MKLEQTNERTVAVEMDINGRRTLVKGRALYEEQPGLGYVLRIVVNDPAGEFELILDEARWNGEIAPDVDSGCDYRIELRSCSKVS